MEKLIKELKTLNNTLHDIEESQKKFKFKETEFICENETAIPEVTLQKIIKVINIVRTNLSIIRLEEDMIDDILHDLERIVK